MCNHCLHWAKHETVFFLLCRDQELSSIAWSTHNISTLTFLFHRLSRARPCVVVACREVYYVLVLQSLPFTLFFRFIQHSYPADSLHNPAMYWSHRYAQHFLSFFQPSLFASDFTLLLKPRPPASWVTNVKTIARKCSWMWRNIYASAVLTQD